ncbi:hypothetical protein DZC72_17405 [Maribacter algicola]|uniref:Macroglobulin domain-containing protein n=1 Tax=Maribacter algicola TaxID=2498892 RepID=A0A426REU4_9FLAO|nr:MG2 domain-containing protein [Maribacter algicola]RRQ47511.1 hypothetical protein DZC72_17405 [Maribacter algicola]
MKKLRPFLFLACLFMMGLISFDTPVQESVQIKNILGKLLLYSKNERPEKTYLLTDKDFYTNGETIWFKTYLVDGIDHKASNKSKVVHVELVGPDGQVVERRKQFAMGPGAEGEIRLDQELEQGEYTLRAYTKYMLNEDEPILFEKNIHIWMQSMTTSDFPENSQNLGNSKENGEGDASEQASRTIVRFFPEGGQLVYGMATKLGIEVTDGLGNGLAARGSILDGEGNIVTDFNSGEFGLGMVNLKPLPGKTYYARLNGESYNNEFELPKAINEGYLLNVTDRGEYILVQVATNLSDGLQGALLLGHLRGEVFLKQVVNGYGTKEHAVKIYPEQLKEGVAQFTLFTAKGEPVSERLFFVENPDQRASLSMDTDRKSYGTRDRIQIDLALADSEGNSLEGEFSMSVVSDNSLTSEYSRDIRSWLLLDSDVGATVPDAGYFFKDASQDRKQLLDALMLTHGWRRFEWQELLRQKTSKKLRFPPEKGITISGRTVSFHDNEKPRQSVASLTLMGEDLIYEKDSTDIDGRFSFGNFYFQDSLDAILQAESISKKPRSIDFILDSTHPMNLPAARKNSTKISKVVKPDNDYLLNAYKKKVADFKYDPKEVTQLDEVVVTEKKKTRKELINEAYNTMFSSSPFSRRVYRDSIFGGVSLSAMDLLARISGVWVTGTYPFQQIKLPGGPKSMNAGSIPGVMVDGVWSDITYLQGLRAIEVSFMDVNWADTTIFGSQGGAGVISIYTEKGLTFDEIPEKYPGIKDFKIPGFNKVREFYTPNYSLDKKEHEKPDYRSTLFWEPNIMLKKEGDNKLEFFTGDNPGRYLIKMEGLTNDGIPVSHTVEIEVDSSN